ncbi:hypothetical protein ACL6C3_23005 [Capilliphycus salinus ALCB114379]
MHNYLRLKFNLARCQPQRQESQQAVARELEYRSTTPLINQ